MFLVRHFENFLGHTVQRHKVRKILVNVLFVFYATNKWHILKNTLTDSSIPTPVRNIETD